MKKPHEFPSVTPETVLAAFEETAQLFKKNIIETNLLIKESKQQRKEERQQRKEEKQQFEEWRKKFDETGKRIDEANKQIGGILNSNGDVAESYFINSFENTLFFAGQEYDSMIPNLSKKSKKLNLKGEYDIVMYNCTSVAIIEIKYKAKKEHIEPLLQKPQTFKQLFPEYANFDIYLGLAGLTVNKDAEKEAIKQGVGIIKQVGENMVINDGHLKAF